MTFKEDVDLQIHKIEGDNGNLQEKKEAYIEKANRETKLNNRLLEMLQELRGVVPFRNPELFDEVESIEADTGGHLEDIPEPVHPGIREPRKPEDEILKEVVSNEELVVEEKLSKEQEEEFPEEEELITEEEEERMGERMEDDATTEENEDPDEKRGMGSPPKEIPF